jgi:hypothetical protein
MANILDEIDSRSSESARYSVVNVAIIGALLGIIFWGLTVLIGKFMIEPIFCKSGVSRCASSIGIAGDISTILVATIGIMIMIGLKMIRPLIVSVSSRTRTRLCLRLMLRLKPRSIRLTRMRS